MVSWGVCKCSHLKIYHSEMAGANSYRKYCGVVPAVPGFPPQFREERLRIRWPIRTPASAVVSRTISEVVTGKFVDGLPLYRQEKIFPREGIDLSRLDHVRLDRATGHPAGSGDGGPEAAPHPRPGAADRQRTLTQPTVAVLTAGRKHLHQVNFRAALGKLRTRFFRLWDLDDTHGCLDLLAWIARDADPARPLVPAENQAHQPLAVPVRGGLKS